MAAELLALPEGAPFPARLLAGLDRPFPVGAPVRLAGVDRAEIAGGPAVTIAGVPHLPVAWTTTRDGGPAQRGRVMLSVLTLAALVPETPA